MNSQVMRISWSRPNEKLQINVGDRELNKVHHFKCLGSVLTREIKMGITMAKVTINIKTSFLTSKLNIELRKKLVKNLQSSILQHTNHPSRSGPPNLFSSHFLCPIIFLAISLLFVLWTRPTHHNLATLLSVIISWTPKNLSENLSSKMMLVDNTFC